ncbi:hypothetical protein MMC28_006468 [Mycoblastus sanguinarius]|nr:hypothetical protein [Mycoblastus sanguinarius]
MSPNHRRKSLTIFKPDVAGLTPINEPPGSAPAGGRLKKRRSFFSSSSSSSPTSSSVPPASPSTPIKRSDSKSSMTRLLSKSRPRSLQQSGRPASFFGSLRSLHSLQDEDDDVLTRASTTPTSTHFNLAANDYSGNTVVHSGEVQTAAAMFKRKSYFLVLTDTHLVRFKSRSRAQEVFPSIPSSIGRASGIKHSRMSSSGSLHELHTSSSSEGHHGIALHHVVAVWKPEDGKPYFSIEIDHLDDKTNCASALTLQLHDPKDYDLWMSSIRGAAMKARLAKPQPFSQSIVDYTARALESERDYDPTQFHMFKVVQRSTSRSGARSSTDDLTKLSSNICILAVGSYKIHLIPLPKSTRTTSSTSLSDMNGASYGITTLTSLSMQNQDDGFSLIFRIPLRQQSLLSLASVCVTDIALFIRQAADYLRPVWFEEPFTWNVPRSLDDELLEPPTTEEDYRGFDRTLTAYSAGYGIDTSKIRYAVNHQCEDAPAFELYPPADSRRSRYTTLELLAIMRSLRYNENFVTLSFRNINLDALHGLRDPYGRDHVLWTTKSGELLNIPEDKKSSLLVQEVQALALKSKRLRRVDFAYCLTRKLQKDHENSQELGCGICEALFPLCIKQYTNIDWIILNGIVLNDLDIDYLFSAAIDKMCHFRALDLGSCGLVDRSMTTVLHAISHQGATMESIDLSGNPARLEPRAVQDNLGAWEFIRKLNLSNINITSGPEPLIARETLLAWKLVELRLSRTWLNDESINALSTYLRSEQSQYLRLLDVDQCKLTGRDAAILLFATGDGSSNSRDLHIQLNENRLEEKHDNLVNAISFSRSPSQITMRMLEYKNEKNFQRLIEAFAKNRTTKFLDISKASLPTDASEATCEALHRMFAENCTLEELDISGEQAHLEAASYGNRLNHALAGLTYNESLKVLRIEYQKLGLQGASTLASVLGENRSLREIHCENNEINLQAFTVLVNSLEQNTTVLYLPFMDSDRAWTQKKVDREIENIRDNSSGMSVAAMSSSTRATVKRTLGKTLSGQRSLSARFPKEASPMQGYTETDLKAAMGSLSQNWDREVARLENYLSRNYNLAHGLPLKGQSFLEVDRPGTGDSLATALQNLDLERTPTAELNRQLIDDVNGAEEDGIEEVADGGEEEGEVLEMKE